MDIILAIKAIVMGLVEGFTEFLPISSTGHLILTGSLLNFTDEKSNVFKIVIQAAAMMAVWWEFSERINAVFRGLFTDPKQQMFGVGSLAAFISAFLCIRWLLRYISSHDFTVFAWYRIAFGILVIASSHYGWVVWAE